MHEMTSMTPIADAVAALPPTDPNSAFGREQAALRREAAPTGAVLGSVFPDPVVLGPDGRPTSIGARREGRPAVVVLYRGAWCPFCNIALKTYRDELLPSLRSGQIQLIAVSPQHPDGSLTMQEKHDLDFAVLSDPGNRIARGLGVLTRPSDDARHLQLEHGLDLTAVNADGSIDVPMPTVAIIDAKGLLRWIDTHPDYTTRTEPAQVLTAIKDLGL
ncbi:peroxiredoxin-like family protein [Humibacter soli]